MSGSDFPFHDVVAAATRRIDGGFKVFQKFTCAGCGNRLTMEEPNVFHTSGTCDKCNTVTDIEANGCNFMMMIGKEVDSVLAAVKTAKAPVKRGFPQ